jgi:hypothetical protein
MPCKATTALIALLVFGFPSVVLADINNRAGPSSFIRATPCGDDVQRPHQGCE